MLKLEYLNPRTLAPNPGNWRVHPESQQRTFRSLLNQVGWADALLFNKKTGRLIDGHGRRDVAIADGVESVPVLVGEWTESEEATILASKDLLGGMAQLDPVAFDSLLAKVESTSGELSAMLADAALRLDVLGASPDPQAVPEAVPDDRGAEDPADIGPRHDDPFPGVPDAGFPSDTSPIGFPGGIGIPMLDPKMQADAIELPAMAWGSVSRSQLGRGTLHFYVDDNRFRRLWADPSPVAKIAPPSLVECNFTIDVQMPSVLAAYNTFRKRWLSRYWQSVGCRVFVDLNVPRCFEALNLAGVPEGWRAYATRSHRDTTEGDLRAQYALAESQAGCRPVFAVFGGGNGVEALCGREGWLWAPDHLDSVQRARRGESDG